MERRVLVTGRLPRGANLRSNEELLGKLGASIQGNRFSLEVSSRTAADDTIKVLQPLGFRDLKSEPIP